MAQLGGAAGFIFGCARNTEAECLSGGVFGLPATSADEVVAAVWCGMPLFLFNFQTRVMHGVFQAATAPGWNLKPGAFAGGRSSSSPYPIQVGVARVLTCPSISEAEAFPVLSPNYMGGGGNRFRFELSEEQVHALLVLFDEAAAAQHGGRSSPGARPASPAGGRKRPRSASSAPRHAPKKVGVPPLTPEQVEARRLQRERQGDRASVPHSRLRKDSAGAGKGGKSQGESKGAAEAAEAFLREVVLPPATGAAAGRSTAKSSAALAGTAVAATAAHQQQQLQAGSGFRTSPEAAPRTTMLLHGVPGQATSVSAITDALPAWGVDPAAIDFLRGDPGGATPDGGTSRSIVFNFTSAAAAAALQQAAHGRPWSELLPGLAAQLPPRQKAFVSPHEVQGRTALQVHYGAKAKTLDPLPVGGRLRLPFGVPIFFRAAAPRDLKSAASATANGTKSVAAQAATTAASTVPKTSAFTPKPALPPGRAPPAKPDRAATTSAAASTRARPAAASAKAALHSSPGGSETRGGAAAEAGSVSGSQQPSTNVPKVKQPPVPDESADRTLNASAAPLGQPQLAQQASAATMPATPQPLLMSSGPPAETRKPMQPQGVDGATAGSSAGATGVAPAVLSQRPGAADASTAMGTENVPSTIAADCQLTNAVSAPADTFAGGQQPISAMEPLPAARRSSVDLSALLPGATLVAECLHGAQRPGEADPQIPLAPGSEMWGSDFVALPESP